jgi:hypothetical protein
LNAYMMIAADYLVFTRDSLKSFNERMKNG